MADIDFNWVAARDSCSLAAMFERLRRGVVQDIKAWEALRGQASKVILDSTDDSFTVVKNGRPDAPRAVFALNGDKIDVRSPGSQGLFLKGEWSVTVTLNRDRECRFLLREGESLSELECWQVRMKALEPLLFRYQTSGAPADDWLWEGRQRP